MTDYNEDQLEAIRRATSDKALYITGSAGTGKTTVIKGIVEALKESSGNNYPAVMAMAGKAAARIRQHTGLPATTIHSGLGFNGTRFNRKLRCPVIIDEASMVCSWLLASILEAEPTKVILVGDVAQLTAVGRGAPFHNLCDHFPQRRVELKTCYRASGAIHIASQAVREGKDVPRKLSSGGEYWEMLETGGPHPTTEKVLEWVRKESYDPEKDIILTGRNGDANKVDGGVHNLNRQIKCIVNPSDKDTMVSWEYHQKHHGKPMKNRFDVGDRIMITENDSKVGIWNGDVGTVTAVDHGFRPYVEIDGSTIEGSIHLTRKHVNKAQLAYAVTIHKSQGSEYRKAMVVCLDNQSLLLKRNLLYTGVTRAQKAVQVVGQMGAFHKAIRTVQEKRTILAHALGAVAS